MAHTIDQAQAELTNVIDWMAQAHTRWVECKDDQRDMFGDSEHDFWYGTWRALDSEGLRLLSLVWKLRDAERFNAV